MKVLCSDRFAVGNTAHFSAVRLATCSPRSMEELERGLQVIRTLVENNQAGGRGEEFII